MSHHHPEDFSPASALAQFLQEETGSIWGSWRGVLNQDKQIELLGVVFPGDPDGILEIDGENERIARIVPILHAGCAVDEYREHERRWPMLIEQPTAHPPRVRGGRR